MILDSTLTFCDGTAITGTTGTALVGDVVDLDVIGRRIAENRLSCHISMHTTLDSTGGASTIQFILATDSSATIQTDGTATVLWASEVMSETQLVKGASIDFKIPTGSVPANERYMGILVVRAGETVTAGNINAHLALDAQNWVSLPDAL